MTEEEDKLTFNYHGHVKYFHTSSLILPHHYTSLDAQRLTVMYFSLIALDILGSLDNVNKEQYVDYIYFLQLSPNNDDEINQGCFGFIGGTFLGPNRSSSNDDPTNSIYHQGHLAMIYTALCTLLTLGDDLSRVKKDPIAKGLKLLQVKNGGFSATHPDGEVDTRFVFCACAIASILDLWHCIDIPNATEFLKQCKTYEAAFGLVPGSEAQGGATYCAIASLQLMNTFDQVFPTSHELQQCIYWCEQRQIGGYNGRTNKDADTCYSFWVGACLEMCDRFMDSDFSTTKIFLLRDCQLMKSSIGGFGKYPDSYPDILHSFYSLAWLTMYAKTIRTPSRTLQSEEVGQENEELRQSWQTLRPFNVLIGICEDRIPSTLRARLPQQQQQEGGGL